VSAFGIIYQKGIDMSKENPQPDDWNECFLTIWDKYHTNTTEKAYCFLLWEKKRIAFPKKFMKHFAHVGDQMMFSMPKWYVREHKLQSLMDKEQKEAEFPKKKKPGDYTPSLFENEPDRQDEHIKRLGFELDVDEEPKNVPTAEELPPWF
jgi:hypothetical protein